jgi:hypothetical protein
MKRVVTTNATILCSHGGRVVLDAHQHAVTAGGSLMLRDGDLVGRAISGCGKKKRKCTIVVGATGTNPNVLVAGQPVHLESLTGVTNGGGTIRVVDPGQATVLA